LQQARGTPALEEIKLEKKPAIERISGVPAVCVGSIAQCHGREETSASSFQLLSVRLHH